MWKRVERAYASLHNRVDFKPQIGLVLGSGLGALAEEIESVYSVPFENIQGMPTSTVQGHSGRFVFGYINRVPVVIMQGRVHYYEGYTAEEIGQILGKNTNTVYTLLTRARKMLKTRLEGVTENG